ncbi:hypothetical protein RCL1_006274 [Eukaryota sp. TZLM3-RCL]
MSRFTCVTCSLVFDDPDSQREHYSTDFHVENLKRKCSGEHALTYESFLESKPVSSCSSKGPKQRIECLLCRKSFSNEKSFIQHCQSSKHIEREREQLGDEAPEEPIAQEVDNTEILEVTDCLFCDAKHNDIETNLAHMKKEHSFFIPDIEHVVDLEGFLEYLTVVIGIDITCLWCLNKGKGNFHRVDDLKAHMRDKGHSKIDFSVFGDALAPFYDYDSNPVHKPCCSSGRLIVDVEYTSAGKALVMTDGTRIFGRDRLLSAFHARTLVQSDVNGNLLTETAESECNELATANPYAHSTSFRQRSRILREQKKQELDLGIKANKLAVVRMPIIY